MRFITRGVMVCCAVAFVAVVVAWLFLSSALFSSFRTTFVENLISKKLGQDVLIEDEVRLGLGRQLQVSAAGLVLPGAIKTKANLAAIDKLEFNISARDLWNSKLSLSELSISGVHLNLLTDKDGVGNWQSTSQTGAKAGDPAKPANPTVAGILTDHKIDLIDVTVLYKNDLTTHQSSFLLFGHANQPNGSEIQRG